MNKTGLEDLVRGLHEEDVALISTGGSAALIASFGLPGHRGRRPDLDFPNVSTAASDAPPQGPRRHPRRHPQTRPPEQLAHLGIKAVRTRRLQPLSVRRDHWPRAPARRKCRGRSTSAARAWCARRPKNQHPSVAIVTDPRHTTWSSGRPRRWIHPRAAQKLLAARAFTHTADYDVAVASWLGNAYADTSGVQLPAWVGASWTKAQTFALRREPPQRAALYRSWTAGLASAEQIPRQGDVLQQLRRHRTRRSAPAHDHGDQPTVAIIKHANPCGIAVRLAVVEGGVCRAHACDPVSAWRESSRPTVSHLATARALNGLSGEVVAAPAFDADALEVLREEESAPHSPAEGMSRSRGGAEIDPSPAVSSCGRSTRSIPWSSRAVRSPAATTPCTGLVAGSPADAATLADLEFAWRAVRAVKVQRDPPRPRWRLRRDPEWARSTRVDSLPPRRPDGPVPATPTVPWRRPTPFFPPRRRAASPHRRWRPGRGRSRGSIRDEGGRRHRRSGRG